MQEYKIAFVQIYHPRFNVRSIFVSVTACFESTAICIVQLYAKNYVSHFGIYIILGANISYFNMNLMMSITQMIQLLN